MRLQRIIAIFGILGLARASGPEGRPNIVFILTDDQDTHMNSLEYMPYLQKHLISQGTNFERHYCTVAICCPSRVNLWTGQMAHNTNVTDVTPPYGGYPRFVENGFNDNHLALWMQQSGYNTYYAGKMFNAHTTENYKSPLVRGYTGSDFLLDPFTYQYLNASTTRNGQPPVNFAGQYSPDLTANSAYEFLEEALSDSTKPFFLTIAPVAPHADVTLYPKMDAGPPKVAPRHQHLFKDYQIPRTDNFNPENPSGVSWVSKLERLNETVIEYNDEYQRCRLRSLQAVDEMLDKVVTRLDEAGALDNTYIIYTSDNGYHISQHRMHPGKECGFETDINVPLIIRGPGVPKGRTERLSTSHTDLAPTVMKLAGNSINDKKFDGAPIPLDGEASDRSEHVAIEFWGLGVPEGRYGYAGKYQFINGTANAYVNNTYKGLRVEGDTYSLYYSVWCTNETELYDLKRDPGQIRNLLSPREKLSGGSQVSILGRDLKQVVSRLDSLMMVLKSCKEETCLYPWKALHPKENVRSLSDALQNHFDAFYDEQPRVSFTKCELGYIKESEGPQEYVAFGENQETAWLGDGSQKPIVINPNWSLWV